METHHDPPPRPVRWWPATVLTLLYVAVLAVVRMVDAEGQTTVTVTFAATVLWVVALLLWLTLFSRFDGMVVTSVWLGLILAVLVFVSLFRFRGMSGDLVPLFEPRWRQGVWAVADPVTAPVEAEGEGGDGASAPSAEDSETESVDYPQFLGAERTARVHGVSLARSWEERPPRLLWRRPVGKGWSGFAVAHGQAITQEQQGDEERVTSYDLETGAVQWSHTSSGSYANLAPAGPGPRATPTIVEDRVYAMGSLGRLVCLDRRTGEERWQRETLREAGAEPPQWGVAASPLVTDGLVVVSAGGPAGSSVVAYDAASGEPVWRGGDAPSAYASPLVATLAGVRQVVVFNGDSVAGHALTDGGVLWSHPWPAGQPNVAQPVVLSGDRVLVSAGYGVGSELLEITRSGVSLEARRIWRSPRLKAKFTNVVLYRGRVYGLDDGVLVCLDPATGERCWKRGRYGHGQIILVDDLLLVQTETGEVVLVEVDPTAPHELGRFRALRGKVWNSPAFAAPFLLVRNDREAAAWVLPLEEDARSLSRSVDAGAPSGAER